MKNATSTLGKYQILEPLGEGNMGAVSIAYDPDLERQVALKRILAARAADPELRERFEREAKAAAKLQHRNLVTVYDLGYDDGGVPFIVMELLKGQSLGGLIESGDSTLKEKLELSAQIADGLAEAHRHGIVHRDIKPENVFVTNEDIVKIMDFGLARVVQSPHTTTGRVMGTPSYMAPEQIRGEKVDGRADLFSLGVVLYRWLTGGRAFKATAPYMLFAEILQADPAPLPPLVNSRFTKNLQTMMDRLLAKAPGDRYASAAELATNLRKLSLSLTKLERRGRLALDLTGRASAPEPPTHIWPSWPVPTLAGGLAAVAVFLLATVFRPAAPPLETATLAMTEDPAPLSESGTEVNEPTPESPPLPLPKPPAALAAPAKLAPAEPEPEPGPGGVVVEHASDASGIELATEPEDLVPNPVEQPRLTELEPSASPLPRPAPVQINPKLNTIVTETHYLRNKAPKPLAPEGFALGQGIEVMEGSQDDVPPADVDLSIIPVRMGSPMMIYRLRVVLVNQSNLRVNLRSAELVQTGEGQPKKESLPLPERSVMAKGNLVLYDAERELTPDMVPGTFEVLVTLLGGDQLVKTLRYW